MNRSVLLRSLRSDLAETFVKIADRIKPSVHCDINHLHVCGEEKSLCFIDTQHDDRGANVDAALLLE